ncbi:MAG: bifunctional 3-deoxy-7-phosphoheptulonate synthase/chorismate mutase type II [Bacteroidetes bacterium]|uniref:chorismate mutase n=1 Tax=Candidatus Merdivivens pullicola TaxID=2840872 RepID=A0A9D9IKN0_9BACT|nr:bifunctional 3-deoxy-7-phosphoheptulonate synthase/chorismate mutase type II [Candidatus Merdivivens pullicola]
MDRSRFTGWGAFVEAPGFPVVAGPCSAESREQVLSTASELSRRGIRVFRAGAWKPRTRPGTFEGVGEAALEWLVQAKDATGMKVGTEAASAYHVKAIISAGLDFIWVGARTTANPFLVQEIADALEGADIPVFVKNPVNPDADLWAGAIERFRKAGISRIAAVHRGVTSYSRIIYRNDPCWQMPITLRLRFPRLPMFCDPSHIAGDRRYVDEISRKAMDLDFDGLFIESHVNPACALSDAAQQITPEELSGLLLSLVPKETDCDSPSYHESIEQLRARIDEIDDNIVSLLADRMDVSGKIGGYKKENSVSVLQGSRWDAVMSRVLSRAEAYGLDKDFIKDIFDRIHRASIEKQENC